ncbi:unnamed protein product [Gadus morhua 'NCC']
MGAEVIHERGGEGRSGKEFREADQDLEGGLRGYTEPGGWAGSSQGSGRCVARSCSRPQPPRPLRIGVSRGLLSRRGQTRGGQPIRPNKSPDEPVGVAGACRPKPRPPPSAAQSQDGVPRRGTAAVVKPRVFSMTGFGSNDIISADAFHSGDLFQCCSQEMDSGWSGGLLITLIDMEESSAVCQEPQMEKKRTQGLAVKRGAGWIPSLIKLHELFFPWRNPSTEMNAGNKQPRNSVGHSMGAHLGSWCPGVVSDAPGQPEAERI